MTQTPSRSADDFLNFRMRLLAEIEDIESSIADVARERASIVAEASALDLELGKHSTTLAAAGVGTRRRSSLCGGGGGGPTASAQQEAAVVAAEMYASVDISAAGIADEEMLLRLLSALDKSERELAYLAQQAQSASSEQAALAPRDGEAVAAELRQLRAEVELLQPQLLLLSSTAPRV